MALKWRPVSHDGSLLLNPRRRGCSYFVSLKRRPSKLRMPTWMPLRRRQFLGMKGLVTSDCWQLESNDSKLPGAAYFVRFTSTTLGPTLDTSPNDRRVVSTTVPTTAWTHTAPTNEHGPTPIAVVSSRARHRPGGPRGDEGACTVHLHPVHVRCLGCPAPFVPRARTRFRPGVGDWAVWRGRRLGRNSEREAFLVANPPN